MQAIDTTTTLVNRYFAAWNMTDTAERTRLVAETWADDGAYLDPVVGGEGHAGIDAMIARFQARFPGLRFYRNATIDAHHDRLRFSWVLVSPDGPVIAAGTDIAVLSGDGRLRSVTGFFDQAPDLS